MQLIQKVLEKEKTAIVLVPEISLTPQMLERFISRFGKEEIAILHSKLSIGERHDEWERIREGKAKIVIGARSAIFAPPYAPETIPMRVMPIWIVERNFSGSSSCFSTPLARLFPLLTRVSSRALLDDTSAISYMAKMPFNTNKSRMIINSI